MSSFSRRAHDTFVSLLSLRVLLYFVYLLSSCSPRSAGKFPRKYMYCLPFGGRSWMRWTRGWTGTGCRRLWSKLKQNFGLKQKTETKKGGVMFYPCFCSRQRTIRLFLLPLCRCRCSAAASAQLAVKVFNNIPKSPAQSPTTTTALRRMCRSRMRKMSIGNGSAAIARHTP